MKNVQDIVEEIKRLEKELRDQIQTKEEEFLYTIKGKKVLFDAETREFHKTLATKIHTYLLDSQFLNILTAPVIWSCIVPAVFMDLVVTVYQFICFRVYKIPPVQRADYIVVDRQSLAYLNLIEKINCVYCGYFNGLIAYVQEIAARTEQYWCPIKHARRLATMHTRYGKFIDYGDHQKFKEQLESIRRDFNDLGTKQ